MLSGYKTFLAGGLMLLVCALTYFGVIDGSGFGVTHATAIPLGFVALQTVLIRLGINNTVKSALGVVTLAEPMVGIAENLLPSDLHAKVDEVLKVVKDVQAQATAAGTGGASGPSTGG